MRRWLTLIVSLLVLVAAACGDGGGGGGDGDAERGDEPAQQGDEGAGEASRDQGDEEPETEPLSYQDTIDLTVEDVENFWSEQLPETYDIPYEQIAAVVPYDSGDTGDEVSECAEGATYEDIAGNAFYCELDDVIAYDDEELFPRFFDEFGPFAIALALSHEWGHAIQGRTGDLNAGQPSVLVETQADCFAGAWTARVDAGDSELLVLDPGDLDVGLAGLLEVRDARGTDPNEPGAHGSGFDRVNAFQEGFEEGAERCRTWYENQPTITEIPFTSVQDLATGGDLPLDELVPLVLDDLEIYWSGVITPYDPPAEFVGYDATREALLEPCESLGLDPDEDPEAYELQIFYCPDDDTIYYDEELFDIVHEDIGDVGVAVLISNAWATAMQSRLDLEGAPVELALQADCFSGAWTGSIAFDLHESVIELSPGDLDEVVQSFLLFGDSADEDVATASGFERVDSFSTGFFTDNAEQVCAESV